MLKLLIFSFAWTAAIYAVNSLVARKLMPVHFRPALLHISTMIALGLLGEVIFDTVYSAVFHRALWEYHVLPIHNAFTSIYSIFLWGAIGFHLYLLHDTLRQKQINSIHVRALIFCLEAIILEALVNLSFLAVFNGYVYFYLPSDLWHITSLQTLPFYLLAGYITLGTLQFASQRSRSAIIGSTLLALIIVLGGLVKPA